MQEVETFITDFSSRGNGVGTANRKDGLSVKVEVPFTIPGDVVRVSLGRKRKGRYLGRLEQICEESKERIKPRCNHFGVCGGCRWQQISYEKQLELKERIVKEAFAELITPQVQFHPIIPCDTPWQYRNKMEFSFSSDREKNHYLGLIMDSSRGKVFNLEECHLVNSWFVDALKATRQWWVKSGLEAFHFHRATGSLRTLTVREGKSTGDRQVMLTVSGNPDYALKRDQIDQFVFAIREAIEPEDPSIKLSLFLRIHQAIKGSPTQFYEMHLYGSDIIREELEITLEEGSKPQRLKFSVSPSAFFQPNTRQAEKLYSHALQIVGIPQGGVVYDLYCGTGTLGICAAQKASKVIGIELSPESSLDARTNVTNNGLENVMIHTGSVDEVLKRLSVEDKVVSPDIVMVDPPRAGLTEEALKQILLLNSPKILYISCNPKTQASNIEELTKQGYRLTQVCPVDQFPQTVHIENIAVLVK